MQTASPTTPFARPRDYPRLRRGARALLEAQLPRGPHRRYLRELADRVDFGGMTIATPRPLPTGSLVRLRLYAPPAPGDPPPLRATALVRWRRAWHGERLMALQFLDFEGLAGRPLARCLATVLAVPAEDQPRSLRVFLGSRAAAGRCIPSNG
jgi:PilZ domain